MLASSLRVGAQCKLERLALTLTRILVRARMCARGVLIFAVLILAIIVAVFQSRVYSEWANTARNEFTAQTEHQNMLMSEIFRSTMRYD